MIPDKIRVKKLFGHYFLLVIRLDIMWIEISKIDRMSIRNVAMLFLTFC